MKCNPTKILIILHGSIGDVVRAIPTANALRAGYPSAKIAWAIEPAALPLVEHHAAVDEPIVFDRRQWRKSLVPFLRRIRRERFDLVLDLQRLFKSGLISWWSGAPYRIGFHRRDAKEFNWLFNNHRIPAEEKSLSKLMHYLRFVEYLGLNTAIRWDLPLTPQDEGRIKMLLNGVGRFAVFFVGSRWESKKWFPDQTARCADAIQRRHGLRPVLLGSAEDSGFAREVQEACRTHPAILVGQTTLGEAVGIIRQAEVAVGPDTGLMHVAAAVGTPVVSLWGATSPERTGPYGCDDLVIRGKARCSPCYLRRCPIGRPCMQSIDVEEVAARVAAALPRKPMELENGGRR